MFTVAYPSSPCAHPNLRASEAPVFFLYLAPSYQYSDPPVSATLLKLYAHTCLRFKRRSEPTQQTHEDRH